MPFRELPVGLLALTVTTLNSVLLSDERRLVGDRDGQIPIDYG